MNTEFKPKLITLRSSGEKISDQDPAVTADEVDEIVNSSQKNLQGLQSALQLRKLRYVIHYTLYIIQLIPSVTDYIECYAYLYYLLSLDYLSLQQL